jgi:alkanesulfonate monooxygenase SsuD/methylene tetrahydromethanopterin reductase-like flavin-dependent oxidoreductase (luciferase family)
MHEPTGPQYAVRAVNGPLSHQRPRPPILIGGKGPRMLTLAAREADIVGILPQPAEQLAAAVRLVVRESERRASAPEINVVMMPGASCTATTLGGSVDVMADHLLRQRDELGISYIGFTDVTSSPEDWAELVERLADT